MKQHILFGILMLVLVSTLSHSAPSQHIITGSMGVGVTSPEADLDVDGTIKTDTSVEFADGSTQSTAATPNGNNFRLGTAKYDGVTVSTQSSAPRGVSWNPYGTVYFEIDTSTIYQHSCTDAWNLSSCSYDSSSLSTQSASEDIYVSPDGTKMYEASGNGAGIWQYTCTTPWTLSSCSYDSVSISGFGKSQIITGITFNPNGRKLYFTETFVEELYEYDCSQSWNIDSCSSSTTFDTSTVDSNVRGVRAAPDGTRLYLLGQGSDNIYELKCSEAWNLSSCSNKGTNIDTQDTTPEGFEISLDGKKLIVVGDSSNILHQHSLGAYIAGRLGIGTDAPDTELDVVGTIVQGDAIFAAYDATGGTSISNNSWTGITWDTEIREDATYTHSADSASITISENGWYNIEYECTMDTTTINRHTTIHRLIQDGSAEVDGARAYSYHRTTGDGEDTASISLLFEVTDGSETIIAQAQATDGVISTVANGCRIYIERI